MINTAGPILAAARPARPLGWLRHSLVLAGRSLAKTRRNPGAVINAVITPALFGAVFLYLFGGSVAGSTGNYVQYLFPGILVMGAGLAGMLSTGTAINLDLKNGITDRFRSLPISRIAPLLGSMLADLVRYLGAVVILSGLGTLAGFRATGGPVAAIAAVGLAILFGFCLSWVTVFIGVLIRDPNAVVSIGFFTFLPLQLGTSLAAPVASLPGWLQVWAGVNPVSQVMDACRGLLTGIPVDGAIVSTLLWCGGLFIVFCPLAVRAYARRQ